MRRRFSLESVVSGSLLGLVLLWSFFPVFLTVISSFKDPRRIFEFPPRLIFMPILDNYINLVLKWPQFFDTLKNSLIITAGASILTLACALPAAYALSRYQSRGLRAGAFFMLAVRMFPPIVITIPLFPLLNGLKLIDTHITLIVLYAAFFVSLATWLLKSFIDDVPIEVEEAAYIDGCTTGQVLWKITLPLIAQGMVAAVVFVALFAWNEFLFAFLFTASNAKTAPVIISEMLGSLTGVEWGPLFAATTVQILPMIVFVWLVQKQIVKGMTVGSVKG